MEHTNLFRRLSWLGIISTLILSHVWGQALDRDRQELFLPSPNPHWMELRAPSSLKPDAFFETYSQELGLTTGGKLLLAKKRKSMSEGLEYWMYQQFYQGVQVEGASLIVHIRDGKIHTLHGHLAKDLNLSTIPTINEDTARSHAIKHLGGIVPLTIRQMSEESHIPIGTLAITTDHPEKIIAQEGIRTSYKFHLNSASDGQGYWVFVDANSGEIVRSYASSDHACVTGSVYTPFNGIQSLITNRTWEPFWTHHRLNINCSDYNIRTVTLGAPLAGGTSQNFKDGDNIWGNTINPSEEATVHWIVQESWDYFDQHFNNPGWGGNGNIVITHVGGSGSPEFNRSNNLMRIPSTANSTFVMCNATFNTPIQTWAAVDVVAHEYCHGVIFNAGMLGNQLETGSVNEGFADIFGAMVERQVGASTNDIWLGLQDVTTAQFRQRSFSDPNSFYRRPSPNGSCFEQGIADEFEEPNFWAPLADKYANTGPMVHWFYLLVTGSTHQNGTQVTGIGFDDASKIAFETMVSLPTAAGYADVRSFAVNFAENEWGYCSPQHLGTVQAFNAIRVIPTTLPTQTVNPSITGGSSNLCLNASSTYEATDYPGGAYTWSVSGSFQITQ